MYNIKEQTQEELKQLIISAKYKIDDWEGFIIACEEQIIKINKQLKK